MKKIYTFLFLMTLLFSARAQYGTINSMTTIPPNPTTADTVKLIANSTVGYSPCSLGYSNVMMISPGNYMVDASYCMGLLAALCNATDTFTIGILPAGTNNIYMTLYSDQWVGPNPCDIYSPLDTDMVQVTVSVSTGISHDEISPVQVISVADGFVIKGDERIIQGSKHIMLYSVTGQMLFNKILREGENKINPVLSAGIYFYRLHAGKDFYYGKLIRD